LFLLIPKTSIRFTIPCTRRKTAMNSLVSSVIFWDQWTRRFEMKSLESSANSSRVSAITILAIKSTLTKMKRKPTTVSKTPSIPLRTTPILKSSWRSFSAENIFINHFMDFVCVNWNQAIFELRAFLVFQDKHLTFCDRLGPVR